MVPERHATGVNMSAHCDKGNEVGGIKTENAADEMCYY